MMVKRIALFLLAPILLFSCALGQYNLQQGISSFKVQDYRQAFIRLKPEAENGSADAQYAVGFMYYYGLGVVEDREKAIHWIDCAARQGQVDAIKAIKALRDTPVFSGKQA